MGKERTPPSRALRRLAHEAVAFQLLLLHPNRLMILSFLQAGNDDSVSHTRNTSREEGRSTRDGTDPHGDEIAKRRRHNPAVIGFRVGFEVAQQQTHATKSAEHMFLHLLSRCFAVFQLTFQSGCFLTK